MVRIKVISDVHVEFHMDKGRSFIDSLPNQDVDILVVAGDLCTDTHLETLTHLCSRFPQVVYVLGNHENWKLGIKETRRYLKTIQKTLPNLHYLDNQRKEICGKFFVGSTLWFPKPETEPHPGWVDYRYVGSLNIYEHNKKSQKFLSKNTKAGDIVVTHHMPSQQCVNERYEGDDFNVYFVGDAEDVILHNEPSLWIMGHSHTPLDKQIWKTRCILNPVGYPRENVEFNPDFIVEV